MKIFKFELKLLIVLSITFLLSCEKDVTDIGADLIPDKSQGNVAYIDLVAYNKSNNDSVRADAYTLARGVVGVYEDNIFGKSKAAFNTQIRLDPEGILGTSQIVDSVVLSIFPDYDNTSKKTYTKKLNPNAVKHITAYPLTSYLGKGEKSSMTLQVHRVNTFLKYSDTKYFSNDPLVDLGDLLGTKLIKDSVESFTIKSTEGNIISEATTPGYRISLDKDYFQQNFFDKKESSDLSNNTLFINYFKGIQISVLEESSKFMFSFPKTTMTMVAYYRYKTAPSDTEYKTGKYTFVTNSIYNANKGEYVYDRSTASSQFNTQVSTPNKTEGESQLFLQGMGGPSINVKLDDAQLEQVRGNVKDKGWAIVGAKINLYLTEDFKSKANYIYGYAYNADKGYFLPDVTSYPSLLEYVFNPMYDFTNNSGYYTLNITQHIKDLVEKNKPNDDILINIGNFLKDSDGKKYLGYYRNTRSYEPFRLVFYGNRLTDSGVQDKKLQLEIIYTTNK